MKLTRRDFLKVAGLGMAGASALAIAGCAKSGDEGSTTNTGTSGSSEEKVVIIGIPGNPEVLSPFAAASTGRLHLLPVCYETLGYFTDPYYNGFGNQLMKQLDTSDDQCTYTIHLNEGIYDTKGNEIKASDVKFGWDTAHELGSQSWRRYTVSDEVVDDYTLKIQLIEERVGTITDICRAPTVSEAAYMASPDEMTSTPVSSGQYVMTDCTPGSEYTFVRNDDYWNKDESTWLWKSNPDKVIYKVILEESQMATALETGAINIAVGMGNDNTSRYVGDDDYNMYQLIGNMCYTLLFNNHEGSIFHNNKELRQAVAYAVDVDGIIEGVLGGSGVKLGCFGFCKAADYKEEWADTYYPYDEAKAKDLIAKCGVAPADLKIVLGVGTGTVLEKTAEMVQLYLLAAGFAEVEIKIADTALFSTMKTDWNEWDILIDTNGVQTIAKTASGYDKNSNSSYGNNIFLTDDDKLQEMILPLATAAGSTQDKVDEFIEYTNEMCYKYGMYNTASFTVSTSNIVYVLQDFRSAVIPGEVEFA